MKKFSIMIIVTLLTIVLCFTFTACGKDGVGISSIEKTSSEGLVDTYTITLTNGSTSTFTVTNGKDGENGSDGGGASTGAVTSDDYFRFKLLEDDTYEISARYLDMPARVVIPATYQGKAVTRIGEDGFYQRASMDEIVIPASIKSINDGAFRYCSGLTQVTYLGSVAEWCEITGLDNLLYYASHASGSLISLSINGQAISGELAIEEGPEVIEDSAFRYCAGLTSVVIPASVTRIGSDAFSGSTDLASVRFTAGSHLTTIGSYAFNNCTSLQSVLFAEDSQLTMIDSYAFSSCTSLSDLEIPDSVTEIGYGVFNDTALPFTEYGGARYYGNWENPYLLLLKATDTSLTSLSVPEGTKIICSNAFSGCNNLREVTLPNGLITIGSSVLVDDYNLESVTIPDSVTLIGDSAFYWCNQLTISYQGTMAQWNAIEKGNSFFTGERIECTDGTIESD